MARVVPPAPGGKRRAAPGCPANACQVAGGPRLPLPGPVPSPPSQAVSPAGAGSELSRQAPHAARGRGESKGPGRGLAGHRGSRALPELLEVQELEEPLPPLCNYLPSQVVLASALSAPCGLPEKSDGEDRSHPGVRAGATSRVRAPGLCPGQPWLGLDWGCPGRSGGGSRSQGARERGQAGAPRRRGGACCPASSPGVP